MPSEEFYTELIIRYGFLRAARTAHVFIDVRRVGSRCTSKLHPFYMFTLINVAKVRIRPPKPDDYGDQYLYWENELQP